MADDAALGASAVAMQAQLRTLTEAYLDLRDRHKTTLAGANAAGAKLAATVPDFVTPLDLQTSPSLKRVGRLVLASGGASQAPPPATPK